VDAAIMGKRTTMVLIIIAVAIALVGGFGFFLINGQIQDQLKVESDKQAQVGSAQQIANRDATAHAAFAQVQSQLRYINDPGDVKSYVPTLLPQIETLAKSYDLQVTSITPGAMTTPPNAAPAAASSASSTAAAISSTAAPAVPAAPTYQVMPLSINLTGSYSQVMKYIYGLTRFPKVVSVKQIGLHPTSSGVSGPKASVSDKVNVSLQMMAYVFTPVTAATAASTVQTSSTSSKPSAVVTQTTSTIAQPRPMHAAMMPPTSNNPLPTPAALKTVNPAKYGQPDVVKPTSAH
jgi:Tfp pilus assembly protein PilO